VRLRRFVVKKFKNLRELKLDFDDVFTTVLVGRNGTGKSNVLEALIIAFRDLDLGRPPAFPYELEYTCRGAAITVDADPMRKGSTLRITVDGRSMKRGDFARKGASEGVHLPNHVFGYYSGPSNRMEKHFQPHQDLFAKALLDGQTRALRPLFYVREVHSQFALLSFFQRESQTRTLVSERLLIEDLESVLFVLKEPSWAKSARGRKSPADNPGDPLFWGARGVVRDFLQRLHSLSLAPLRTQNGARMYLYLDNREKLVELASEYHEEGPDEFFKALESMSISDLVEDVRTRVRIGRIGEPLTFRELSEGEQQLLMVVGLLQFVQTKESLFLLDEPDTHLNPAWSLEYAAMLKQAVGDPESSQIVTATHDPLVIASLKRPEVLLMQRDEDTGRIEARHPDEDPQGMGVSGLLTSDVYGLRSDLDSVTLQELDELRDLSVKQELTPADRARLLELNQRLEHKAFTRTTRDPQYQLYVKAMTVAENREGLDHPVLSPMEVRRRQQMSVQIARRAKEAYQQLRAAEGDETGLADEAALAEQIADAAIEAVAAVIQNTSEG
jgi:predicted ATPase